MSGTRVCPNYVWAWDFVHDRTADGRSFRWLTLIDEYTRECLILHPARTLTGPGVTRELAEVVGRRGAPAMIRSDNRSEFIGQAIREWLTAKRVGTLFIVPGSPWENGYAESLHSRLREEFLNDERFETVSEAKVKALDWRFDFNTTRPHSSLGYQTPREATRQSRLGGVGPLRSEPPPRPTSTTFTLKPKYRLSFHVDRRCGGRAGLD